MTQRRDRKSGRFMTSVLAIALAVSTLSLTPAAATPSAPPCCVRMGASCPLIKITCCGTERPDRAPLAPLPQAPATPAPDLVPLAFSAQPSFDPAVVVAATSVRLDTSPPLYLLHSTLLV